MSADTRLRHDPDCADYRLMAARWRRLSYLSGDGLSLDTARHMEVRAEQYCSEHCLIEDGLGATESATLDREHPEATCERCGRPNAPTWHAPSPLWNAVLRDPATGADAFGVLCPPCFAELAEAKGFRYYWHFGPHEDLTNLWTNPDGRVWDGRECMWVAPKLDSSDEAPREACPTCGGLVLVTRSEHEQHTIIGTERWIETHYRAVPQASGAER